MRFLVVGAGAMGSLFAARLKRAGFKVTLLEKVQSLAQRINEQGITVEGVSGQYHVRVPTFFDRPAEKPDVVLICVKSYDTRGVGDTLRSWLKPDTVILTLQNGLGNMEILAEDFGNEKVLGGVTAEGATVLAPGRIRHAGQGETLIGASRASEGIVSAFREAGFETRAEVNVQGFIWGKLTINVGINALAAITRLKNGRLPELAGTRWVMEEAVREAASVAAAKGICLPYADPVGRVLEVCRATAGNIASMLQDILRQQATEIDFINGAIVREGRSLGIPTPVNLTLTSLVKVLQETHQERV